jgi:hypothetical protein
LHRVELSWPGGQHVFALDLGQLRAVQAACDAGPQRILMRLMQGDWRVDDPLAVLRHGLMGGGMDEAEAQRVVANAAATGGLQRMIVTASLVLGAALTGEDDDPVEQPDAEKLMGAMMANGGSAASMETAPAPDSAPATSTA